MLLKKVSFFELILLTTVTIFICQGTYLENYWVGQNLRWVPVGILLFYVGAKKELGKYLDPIFTIILFLYVLWCIATVTWSEIPEYSFSKSIVFGLMAFLISSAGAIWANQLGFSKSLNWLMLIAGVSLYSAFSGHGLMNSFIEAKTTYEYQGASGSANALGFFLAVSSAFLIWKIYQNIGQQRKCFFWIVLLLIDFFFLLSTFSEPFKET